MYYSRLVKTTVFTRRMVLLKQHIEDIIRENPCHQRHPRSHPLHIFLEHPAIISFNPGQYVGLLIFSR